VSAKPDVQRQFEEYDQHEGDRERTLRAVNAVSIAPVAAWSALGRTKG